MKGEIKKMLVDILMILIAIILIVIFCYGFAKSYHDYASIQKIMAHSSKYENIELFLLDILNHCLTENEYYHLLDELEKMSLIQKNKQLENELEELAKTKIDFDYEINYKGDIDKDE